MVIPLNHPCSRDFPLQTIHLGIPIVGTPHISTCSGESATGVSTWHSSEAESYMWQGDFIILSFWMQLEQKNGAIGLRLCRTFRKGRTEKMGCFPVKGDGHQFTNRDLHTVYYTC